MVKGILYWTKKHGRRNMKWVLKNKDTGVKIERVCLVGSTGSFGRSRCDLSVVSDLKTALTPYCCRQRRSCSDKPST